MIEASGGVKASTDLSYSDALERRLMDSTITVDEALATLLAAAELGYPMPLNPEWDGLAEQRAHLVITLETRRRHPVLWRLDVALGRWRGIAPRLVERAGDLDNSVGYALLEHPICCWFLLWLGWFWLVMGLLGLVND